jgi:hypothetical protein
MRRLLQGLYNDFIDPNTDSRKWRETVFFSLQLAAVDIRNWVVIVQKTQSFRM